jgi:hypothetical protein
MRLDYDPGAVQTVGRRDSRLGAFSVRIERTRLRERFVNVKTDYRARATTVRFSSRET